jgi:RNA polymerase primary sigma factor
MEKKAMIIKMNGVKEQEVDTVARYSIEEELQIIKSIQQGGKERNTAIEKLAQSRLRFVTGFVTAVAKRYANNNLSMDELIEAGNKGLVLAAENFDESRGFKFIPYAIWWVRQSIEKEIEKSNNLE